MFGKCERQVRRWERERLIQKLNLARESLKGTYKCTIKPGTPFFPKSNTSMTPFIHNDIHSGPINSINTKLIHTTLYLIPTQLYL